MILKDKRQDKINNHGSLRFIEVLWGETFYCISEEEEKDTYIFTQKKKKPLWMNINKIIIIPLSSTF